MSRSSFGLAAIPVILGAGIAMDTTRAYMVKLRLGAALDAAALAVGSQSNQGASALTTILNNYFYNNYCKAVPTGASVTACTSTVATETGISVQPTSDITAATVNFSAQATVPTIFMRLVGINNLTVAVTAQTTKFPGMEIARGARQHRVDAVRRHRHRPVASVVYGTDFQRHELHGQQATRAVSAP